MKRLNAPAPKQAALARKRALIRSLIEQHGWSSTTAMTTDGDARANVSRPAPTNVIPFPMPGK